MGRIIALDYGRKRVGVAITDSERRMASPSHTYQRINNDRDAIYFRKLADEERIDWFVVGLPVHGSGAESATSTEARAWGAWLAKASGRPVVFFDERYSSQEADELLREAGLSVRYNKDKRDMLAAYLVLQSYLEAGCPETEKPTLPLDDGPAPRP